ncbi:MAG: hypothetical protein K0V04_41145 [Deltaproteobacteria bacterium]|nr:hypothetical protein [Deltaproteobacteria bacterium]
MRIFRPWCQWAPVVTVALMVVLAEASAVAVPLVSREQVDSARNKAILWGVFAALMLGVFIFRIVRLARKKNETDDEQ